MPCVIDEYSRFYYKGKYIRGHRYVWEQLFGEIPKGMHVCHHCDVRKCVNPDHLFLGTDSDNNIDKLKKGRHEARGGHRHPNAKLTMGQVIQIKELLAKHILYKNIAKKFNVGIGVITRIKLGVSYTEVIL